MSNSTTNTGAVEALAERCQQRASELSDQAELCEIEAAALLGQKEARWAEWEGGKSNAAMMRWRTFLDRLSELQRNAKATREDVEHYRQCATALRATPTPASEAEVIERCARVAQNDTPQSDNPGVVHGEIVASFRIATAIRHLSPPPPPKEPRDD